MRISNVIVKSFRCLGDVYIPLSQYTAFIGPNGAGKSSVLYALHWFFGFRDARPADLQRDCLNRQYAVTVTLSDLVATAAELLVPFVHNGTATFTRTYNAETNTTRFTGTAYSGPGFEDVLQQTGIANKRAAYRSLRETHHELPELTGNFSESDIQLSFHAWCSDPANADKLVPVHDSDAGRIFTDGTMRQIIQFVLIQGSTDLAAQLVSGSRASVLSTLTEKLVNNARTQAVNQWKADHAAEVEKLESLTQEAVVTITSRQEELVNSALQTYLPHNHLSLRPAATNVTIQTDVPIIARILNDHGEEEDVSAHGHGTQRAVMMAMVQALSQSNREEGASEPLLVIAIEEPETYQHPPRIRSFARALSDLANGGGAQVVLATHSQFFVRSDDIASIRKVRLESGSSVITQTSIPSIAKATGRPERDIRKRLESEFNKMLAECFFADLVVLVEGETDKAVIEAIAELMDSALDSFSVHIFPYQGKSNMKLAYHVLTMLDTPVYVVFDGDANLDCESGSNESHEKQTSECLEVVFPTDDQGASLDYQFGDSTTVGFNMTVFETDLEAELRQWPSFQKAIDGRTKKDLHQYRRGVRDASLDDAPDVLRSLISAILASLPR